MMLVTNNLRAHRERRRTSAYHRRIADVKYWQRVLEVTPDEGKPAILTKLRRAEADVANLKRKLRITS